MSPRRLLDQDNCHSFVHDLGERLAKLILPILQGANAEFVEIRASGIDDGIREAGAADCGDLRQQRHGAGRLTAGSGRLEYRTECNAMDDDRLRTCRETGAVGIIGFQRGNPPGHVDGGLAWRGSAVDSHEVGGADLVKRVIGALTHQNAVDWARPNSVRRFGYPARAAKATNHRGTCSPPHRVPAYRRPQARPW